MKSYTLTETEEQEAKDALIEAQKSLPYSERAVEGDASETGLVRFCQTVYDIE